MTIGHPDEASPRPARAPSHAGAPAIDVVILNYNYGRFVGDAIASALAQTRPFGRVIVVNDGSTDDSLDRIAPFGPRIRLVDKPNGGQLSASFAGLAECTADYVWFLDADDYLAETAVAALTPHLASRPVKAQVQLIGVDEARAPRDSWFPTYREAYGSAEMIADNRTIGFYNSAPTSGNIYARSFLEACDPASLDPREPVDGAPNLIAPYFGEILSLRLPSRPLRERLAIARRSTDGRPKRANKAIVGAKRPYAFCSLQLRRPKASGV
jgi:glycosyltransferase involved in cell wall biosynthesis